MSKEMIYRDDVLAACDIAPPDEWNDYTKGGYDFAAEECKRNIAALPAIDPAAIREAALQSRIEQLAATCEELVKERDAYLAERNKYQLYLIRTDADLELEAAAVDALTTKLAKAVEERDIARRLLGAATQMQNETQAKLTKAVEALKKLDRRGDSLETYDPVVHEIVTVVLAELEVK